MIDTNSRNPLVSVVILNYNGNECLEKCLLSVFTTSYAPFEVIVVDNGSSDGSAERASEKWHFRLIKKQKNSGYSAGNNTGIRAARGSFVVLLNNDTIVDSDWLTELVGESQRSKADFCQPKIVIPGPSRIINSTGLTIHLAGFGLLRGNGEPDNGQYDEQKNVCGFHGACIFASKNAIERTGLLDEVFFAYNEDTDWSWRALMMGLKTVYVPSAIVYHSYGTTRKLVTPRRISYAERNRLIMLLTNYSRRSLILLLPALAVTEIATLAYCLSNRILSAKILGYADLLRLRSYTKSRSTWIQARRVVKDRDIFGMFEARFSHPFFGTFSKPLNSIYTFWFRLVASFM
ncbi:MAG: glycosyltransferase family 2 protein [Candidatus Bathyarchaeia archaeon]